MGLFLSAHKRVETALRNSPEFELACSSVFNDCLSLTQHAFSGVKPYQLFSAAEKLHRSLHLSVDLVSKWVPSPPDQEQVDRALRAVLSSRRGPSPVPTEEVILDLTEFVEFAVEVFVDAVVSNAGKEVLKWVPLGAAGIAGVGVVVKPGKKVIAAAIGTYALGVVTNVYLGLAG